MSVPSGSLQYFFELQKQKEQQAQRGRAIQIIKCLKNKHYTTLFSNPHIFFISCPF
jgi:hypothetical protein